MGRKSIVTCLKVLTCAYLTLHFYSIIFHEDVPTREEGRNILDGCYHVYLDVGSNIGMQVRKLYEPSLYPGSYIFPEFDKFFGDPSQRELNHICSVGFEPNPAHTVMLRALEKAYNKCGWNVQMLTTTAVGDRDEERVDYFTDEDWGNLEWGGSVIGNNTNLKGWKGTVKMIRLSNFVKNVVATRKLPAKNKFLLPPAVLMKMDIEGSEIEVLADLLLTGSFLYINKSLVEFHHGLASTPERAELSVQLERVLLKLQGVTKILHLGQLDDETHGKTNFSLPAC